MSQERQTEIEKLKQELEHEAKIASDLSKELDHERDRVYRWKVLATLLFLYVVFLELERLGFLRWLWRR